MSRTVHLRCDRCGRESGPVEPIDTTLPPGWIWALRKGCITQPAWHYCSARCEGESASGPTGVSP